jgi:hypothetical protein
VRWWATIAEKAALSFSFSSDFNVIIPIKFYGRAPPLCGEALSKGLQGTSCAQIPARSFNLADYRPTDFVLERVDLTFELDPTETKVEARLIFHRREGADPKAPLVLDGDELALAGLLFDQKEMKASQYTQRRKA